jgi:hypothetical protein
MIINNNQQYHKKTIIFIFIIHICNKYVISQHNTYIQRNILNMNDCKLNPYICNNGYCYNNICICNARYITISNYSNCDYYQKSARTAYNLQISMGFFGAGLLYIGQYVLGLFQLLLTVIIHIAVIVSLYCSRKCEQYILLCCILSCLLLMITTWILSIIRIKNMGFNDGNNVMLYNDF